MGRMRQQGANNRIDKDKLGDIFQYYLGSESYTNPVYATPYYASCKVTFDEVHPRYPHEGGPLDIMSHSVTFTDCPATPHAGNFYFDSVNNRWTTIGYAYRGNFRVNEVLTGQLPPSASAVADGYGARAWDRLNPYKSDVGLSQALAELRDIKQLALSKLQASYFAIRRIRNAIRKIGNDYLAVQFGWKPMVQDLLSLLDSIKKMDSKLAKMRDQNGKWQRTGGTLFEDSNTALTTGNTIKYKPGNWSNSGTWTKSVDVYERAWTKGVMRYYVPALDDPRWGKFHATRDLWDVNITPKLVYQLTPWTWMLDWFSNAGHVISNLQSQVSDQVAAKYAYVMYTKVQTTHFTALGSHWYNDVKGGSQKWVPIRCSAIDVMENKCRSVADPLGFNFDWSGLTSFQSSILAALGMSRFPRLK